MNDATPGPDRPVIGTYHDIIIPAGPHLRRGIVDSILAGRYERNEIALGLACIKPGARILELGAGAGIVGAILARHCKPAAMVSVEANPRLIPHIRRLHEVNGLTDQINLRHCIVSSAPDAPKTVTFHLRKNFLGSALTADPDGLSEAVEVPVVPYARLTRNFAHDTIMMDIEGAELDFLRHAKLGHINTFVAEFHRRIFGREGIQECRHLLRRAGLVLDTDLTHADVHVFQRPQA